MQVVEDNDPLGRWQGRIVSVTGGTSGIGTTDAQALHATGADVYLTARDPKKAESIVENIRNESPGFGKVDAILMDMDSLELVKEAVRTFLHCSRDGMNVLVNNAGVNHLPSCRRCVV
jgi:NADP-dependent 3-hydroxy acid dehydrogenase YdfG